MVHASCAFGFFVPLMVFGLSKVAIARRTRRATKNPPRPEPGGL
jgi:hypothetical protein